MNRNYGPLILLIIGFLSVISGSCILDRDKIPIPPKEEQQYPPVLNILNISDITDSTAVLEVEIKKDWGFPLINYGACWIEDSPTAKEPTVNYSSKQTSHSAHIDQLFKTGLTHLRRNQSYMVRAYAINTYGTSYSQLIFFNTQTDKSQTVHSVIDIEGNVYLTVTIGTHQWTKENLRTTHFRNGEAMLNQRVSWDKINYPAFRWPEDDSTKSVSGVFYNWYAATDKDQFVPYGWHVATEADFKNLMLTPNYQDLLNLSFNELNLPSGLIQGWWCATDNDPNPYSLSFSGNILQWGKDWHPKTTGFYIRCVKN